LKISEKKKEKERSSEFKYKNVFGISPTPLFLKYLFVFCFKLVFFYCFDILMLKINFLKLKIILIYF